MLNVTAAHLRAQGRARECAELGFHLGFHGFRAVTGNALPRYLRGNATGNASPTKRTALSTQDVLGDIGRPTKKNRTGQDAYGAQCLCTYLAVPGYAKSGRGPWTLGPGGVSTALYEGALRQLIK